MYSILKVYETTSLKIMPNKAITWENFKINGACKVKGKNNYT